MPPARRFLRAGLVALVVAVSAVMAADVLTQFHLSEEDAQTAAFDAVWGHAMDASAAESVFRSLSPQARAAAVTAGAAFVRAYCESDAFRQRYAAMRQSRRPTELTAVPKADVDKQVADTKKVLEDTKAALANLPPEARKMMEAAMKQAGEEGVDLDKQFAEAEKDLAVSAEKQKAALAKASSDAAASQRSAKEFDERYPANPGKFIAMRLREFLDLTATVPAEAPLARRGSKMVFVDPALEQKPALWKQLYRAGRPSVDAARAAATSWLAALEKTGN